MENETKTMQYKPANQQKLYAGKTIPQYKAEVGSPANFDQVLHALHAKCGLSVQLSVKVGVEGYPDLYAEYRKAQSASRSGR
jgi:hypothetical protein